MITPVMADLLQERLDASTAFTNVGVGYICPFTVKVGRKKEKRLCCLFTYLTVRAVHIEVLPKLDSDSCLNAIMRFIACRGKTSTKIRDRGQLLLKLNENLLRTLRHGTKKGSKNV